MEEKKIGIGINDGRAFFSNEMAVNFNPSNFIFDFKCVTPRIDIRSKESPFVSIEHNVIISDPFHTKQILELLSKVVKKYEEQFGKIEKPEAFKKMEKEVKKKSKQDKKDKKEDVNYFG